MADRPIKTESHDDREVPSTPPSSDAGVATAIERLNQLIEGRLAPALERIAMALESAPGQRLAVSPDQAGRGEAIARVRLALNESRWEQAESWLSEFERDFPDDPEAASLRGHLEALREQAIIDLRARLDVSRKVNDPESVIALHDDLTVLLRGEARRELERDIVRWLIALIQRRMRAGTVQPDVVHLAAKVADRFGTTPEGASVRASLPTLRRSAGLCPRCGNVYNGLDDACPRCLAAALGAPSPDAPPANPWAVAPEDEDDEDIAEAPEGEL